MMGSIASRAEKRGQWLHDPRTWQLLTEFAQGAGYAAVGFLLSGAALGNGEMPFCLALLCAMPVGWPVLLTAVGSIAGYWWFWGSIQGQIWTMMGLMMAGIFGGRKLIRRVPLLMPALATLIVSASGLLMQVMLGDETPVPLYLLRVGLAWGATRVYTLLYERRDTWVDWLAEAVGVLALAQVSLGPWLGLGYVAAAALGAGGSFPAAILAGLALDLSQISGVPMTAAACLCCALRMLRLRSRHLSVLYPALGYLTVSALCGGLPDLHPLPGLLLGGACGLLIPSRRVEARHRGGVGIAQVRLELAADVMTQVRQALQTRDEVPVDEAAVLSQAVERACGSCPCQKGCRDREHMRGIPTSLLHRSHLQSFQIPIPCRKVGRVTEEIQRAQEQLRSILAERESQSECLEAMVQQYGFLASFLTELSDSLPQNTQQRQRYQPEVAVCSVGREQNNGDRCLWFAGTGCRYYVLLCDGMGTGLGASQEAKAAGEMLKNLLSAGFPARHALRCLNNLCALRRRAGAVTADLAELRLDTGEAVLYKWGAMPSYLLSRAGAEKIGSAGAPPGLSVTEARETADQLSLRRGQTLVMLSDGLDGEVLMRRSEQLRRETPGEAAAALVETADREQPDDATAVVIRLSPLSGRRED